MLYLIEMNKCVTLKFQPRAVLTFVKSVLVVNELAKLK